MHQWRGGETDGETKAGSFVLVRELSLAVLMFFIVYLSLSSIGLFDATQSTAPTGVSVGVPGATAGEGGAEAATGGLDWGFVDAEIVAVAVGLLFSFLFIDRWRLMEGQVVELRQSQDEALKRNFDNVEHRIEKEVQAKTSTSESVLQSLQSLTDRFFWIEEVQNRRMFVETRSARAVLRTAYDLLAGNHYVHLFEFLDYYGHRVNRNDGSAWLRGSPDDFLELADFCDFFLEDHYLATRFLAEGLRSGAGDVGLASLSLLPDNVMRRIRMGLSVDVRAARSNLLGLVRKSPWSGLWPFQHRNLASDRIAWRAYHALALLAAAQGRRAEALAYFKESTTFDYSHLFPIDQALAEAELQIILGEFDQAVGILNSLEEQGRSGHVGPEAKPPTGSGKRLGATHLSTIAFLYSRMHVYDRAEQIKKEIMEQRQRLLGDQEVFEPRVASNEATEEEGNEEGESPEELPTRALASRQESLAPSPEAKSYFDREDG